MRPLELTLEGFRSYRLPTTFDFQDRGVFGIVGPTGAGKSSILDGLIYGLYGKTPRIGKETKKLITSGCDTARVQLLFEVDGATWEVTRVLRDPGASQIVLRREGDPAVPITGERAVNEAITDIVGLDFDAFCSSVTLPQGEFDRFLKATPSERSKILKRIFRYERVDAMRDAAKRRAAEAENDLKRVQGEMSALLAEPETMLAQLQAELAERDQRVNALREGAVGFAAAQSVVSEAQRRLDEIRKATEEIATSLARIPAAERLEALAAQEDAGISRLASAEAALDLARRLANQADLAADQAEANYGGAGLANARSLLSQRLRVAEHVVARQATLATLRAAMHQAGEALAAQRLRADSATTDEARASELLRATQQGHAAHLLRAGLQPGEACPVCEQSVAVVPAVGPVPAALEAAQKAVEEAHRQARAAGERLTQLHGAFSSAEARLQAAQAEVHSSSEELAFLDQALVDLFGPGIDPARELSRREGLIAASRKQAEAARQRAERALGALSGAQRELETSARQRRQVATELIKVATHLRLEAPGTEDDAGQLAGAAKRARDAALAATTEQAAQREQVLAQEAHSREVLLGLARRLGLGPTERIEDALQSASEHVGRLEERIEQARQAIEQRSVLAASLVEIQVRRDLYQRLATDFTDAKFIAYLLDADRQRLARVGSEKLFQLTGRYRFDEEGQFHLLDLANDVVRSPDTLSGGETFLASLSLALALAEAVSEGGSRLDCFFLDEGFGSLDAASLDLALDGVENLALPGRLIGIISHVGGVQARLEDLIVLDKAADGTTVVVQTEGPIGYATGGI